MVPGALESIVKTLRWARLDYDEGPDRPGQYGPYLQSERAQIYAHHRDRLLESKRAYRCFCSPERLDEMRRTFRRTGSNLTYDRKCLRSTESDTQELSKTKPHVIRLKNSDSPIWVDDLVYGQLKFLNNTQDDVILIKADGSPTYHFANVIDDHHMNISHVLRGEEWLSSTPKHILLYQSLGFIPPKFAHLPLLVNADGSKLSKRSGDVRVEDYINKGYEPEALLNFVALMGMNHVRNRTDDRENTDVMTMDQLISSFSIESIGKHRSTMSQPKLDHLNQQHIAQALASGDPRRVEPWIERAKSILLSNHHQSTPNVKVVPDEYIHRVLLTMKDRLHVFDDLKYLAEYFFSLPDLSSDEAREMRETIPDGLYLKLLEAVHEKIESFSDDHPADFTREAISERLKQTLQGFDGLKSQQLMSTLRHAITGRKIGAGMAESIQVLGKRRTLERIEAAMRWASAA